MCLGNLIQISPTTGTTRLITYSHLQLRQIVNNSSHVKGSLNLGAIVQFRRLKLNRRRILMSLRLNLTVIGVISKQIKTNQSWNEMA